MDNRGSHFYLAKFWAQALAEQEEDAELKAKFADFYQQMADNEQAIVDELNAVQKVAVDIGGYYHPDVVKMDKAMRPCQKWNDILDKAAEKLQVGALPEVTWRRRSCR